MIYRNVNKITAILKGTPDIGYDWVRAGGFKLNIFKPGLRVDIMLRKGKFNTGKLEATVDITDADGVKRRGIWRSGPDGPYSRNHMAHVIPGGKMQFIMGFVKKNNKWYLRIEFPPISDGFSIGKIEYLIERKPKWILKKWFPCKYRNNVNTLKIT